MVTASVAGLMAVSTERVWDIALVGVVGLDPEVLKKDDATNV